MKYEHLITTREGNVEYLTLNRPDVRNAFNEAVIGELHRWAETMCAASVGEVRAVVLAGAGKLFCAGADITWMSQTIHYTEAQNLRDAEAMSRMFAALNELPMPLIGRIHGAALGGGAGLAAVCDIVVADDGAMFGFTEVKLGILPAVISPFALAKIGRSAARELFLTGARFSAARAKEIGLVHAVVPVEELDAVVAGYVREILTAAPGAVAAAKALIPQVWNRPAADAMPITAAAIAARRVAPEGQEGLRAFLEKRSPKWSPGVPTTKDPKDTKTRPGRSES
ncbi:MAG TPA: enoyl-CoA hydratase-related protein [Vicinamibacterales bacterium]|jgi:methylglutaconyl-CoA hydratase|nr:enoyl-CoA hydratase-related protein [Vicinamibacterales bacterium]